MNDKEATIALNLMTGLGFAKYNLLIEKFGSPSAIFQASKSNLSAINGIGEDLVETISNWQQKIDMDRELNLIKKADVKVITINEPEYPLQLKEIHDPPICLYVRGTLDSKYETSIAIVGTRKLTTYGQEMTEFLASGLAFSKWTIISGLAYGVDAAAHKAVVLAKGKTVAVLGGGLARLHPQDHLQLARDIVETGGAIISEFPMEYPPTRTSFPMRNRIISGLSRGVIVVEAGTQSGSLITASFALEQNRQVFAVPGNANSPMSQGCNKLIKDGAKLTENIADIFAEFEFLPGFDKQTMNLTNNGTNSNQATSPYQSGLKEEELAVIKCVELEEKTIDKISAETNISVGKLLAIMSKLELGKIVKQLPGKRFKKY